METRSRMSCVCVAFLAAWLVPAALVAGEPGQATGTVKLDDAVGELKYAYATPVDSFFHEGKKGVKVVLTTTPLGEEAIKAGYDIDADPKALGIAVVIDDEKSPEQFVLYHSQGKYFGGYFHGTEHTFEATTFDGKTIAGRVYTSAPVKTKGFTYSYDVTFSAPIVAQP